MLQDEVSVFFAPSTTKEEKGGTNKNRLVKAAALPTEL